MKIKKIIFSFRNDLLICYSISESVMHRVNDIWAQIYVKTSECIDNQLFQKWNITNSVMIHRIFDYSLHKIVKRWKICTTSFDPPSWNGRLQLFSNLSFKMRGTSSCWNHIFLLSIRCEILGRAKSLNIFK